MVFPAISAFAMPHPLVEGAMIFVPIGKNILPLATFKPLVPLPFVDIPRNHSYSALPLLDIINPLPLILIPILILIIPPALPPAPPKLPLIPIPPHKNKDPLSLNFIPSPLTLIAISIVHESFSFALFDSLTELSLECE